MNPAHAVEEKFKQLYDEQPLIVRSPGRVNLIGEHTDYNMGYVLPGAIDKAIYFAIAPRDDQFSELYAADMHEEHKFSLDDIHRSKKRWPDYLTGVVDQLRNAGHHFNGFNCVFGGDIPIGAGLSSSAAVEAGLAFALNTIFDLKLDKLSLVRLAQKAENEFVGVQCGIMDQFVNIFGADDKVLRLDCRSLEFDCFPFQFDDVTILLFNTNVSHSLASSEYNKRRLECSEGVALIRRNFPHVLSLRDVTPEMLNETASALGPILFRRCKYVVEENLRLLHVCESLIENDLNEVGDAMYRSHEGLSHDYEVSCTELDYLVSLVQRAPGVYGARMMGGGFGGCTINLVARDQVGEVEKLVRKEYKNKFNHDPAVYEIALSEGTNIVTESANARFLSS
jgi:galactokinase